MTPETKDKEVTLIFEHIYWAAMATRSGINTVQIGGDELTDLCPILFFSGKAVDVCILQKFGENFKIMSYPFTGTEFYIKEKVASHGGVEAIARNVGICPEKPSALIDLATGCKITATSFEQTYPEFRSHPLFISFNDIRSMDVAVKTVRGDVDFALAMYILTTTAYSSMCLDAPWKDNKITAFSRDVIGRLVYDFLGRTVPALSNRAEHTKIVCSELTSGGEGYVLNKLLTFVNLDSLYKPKENIRFSELAMVGAHKVIETLREENNLPHDLVMDTMKDNIESCTITEEGAIHLVPKNGKRNGAPTITYLKNVWKASKQLEVLMVSKED